MAEIATLSKSELRDELERAQSRLAARTRRAATMAEDTAEVTGFVLGSLGWGYLEGTGKVPSEIGGIQTELAAGAALFVVSRGKRGKRAAMMRGASYGLLAGALKDIGKNFAG